MSDTARADGWHLDKKVPIALIIALCVQAALGLSWANRISFEVEQLKLDFQQVHREVNQAESALSKVAALEVLIEGLKVQMNAQLSRLDTIIELRTQMKDVMQEIQETRREYRASNARLWDETRNLRNSLVEAGRRPNTTTRSPDALPDDMPLPVRRSR